LRGVSPKREKRKNGEREKEAGHPACHQDGRRSRRGATYCAFHTRLFASCSQRRAACSTPCMLLCSIMKTIEVIPPVQLRGATRVFEPEGEVIYYPTFLFTARLFVKPLAGAEKERQFVVLVDAVDGVARLYRDVPRPQSREVEDARVVPADVDEAAAASAEKRLRTYALAKYRGFSPTRIELSLGRLVHKVFYIRPSEGEGKAATVLDGLTGKETVIR